MNAGSANWNWPEVEAVLDVLAEGQTEPVLCGGQAVAFWSHRYGFEPVVSRDIDLIGDRDDARKSAATLNAAINYPGRYDMTVLAATVRGVWRDRPITIEWLSSVPGIETDPEAISVQIRFGSGHRLRVLHPFALALSKLHALRFFDQEERSDARHLHVVLKIMPKWLDEFASVDAARALRLIQQWSRAAKVAGARRVLSQQEIDWKDAVPLARLGELAGTDVLVGRFLKEHWPRLAE